MDGNGRWAERRGLPRIEGHQQGVQVVREMIEACVEIGVRYLSLFAFSHENWSRPQDEVHFLMELFVLALQKELPELIEKKIKVCFLGQREGLAEHLITQMQQATELTKEQAVLQLNIVLNYTGKWDILNATKQCLKEGLDPHQLNMHQFEKYLSTDGIPEPDLMIRTSGEQRISNFFLWQLAYTELYFTDTLWPDFNKQQLLQALEFYVSKERRFGQTSQQIRER